MISKAESVTEIGLIFHIATIRAHADGRVSMLRVGRPAKELQLSASQRRAFHDL